MATPKPAFRETATGISVPYRVVEDATQKQIIELCKKVDAYITEHYKDLVLFPYLRDWKRPFQTLKSFAKDAVLVENGILKGYMHNRESADFYGVEPTGNARGWAFSDEPIIRMRNTMVLPDKDKLDTTVSGVAFDMLKTVDMVSDELVVNAGGTCGKKQPMSVSMGGPAIRCKLMIGGR